jgi:hypothetical protein
VINIINQARKSIGIPKSYLTAGNRFKPARILYLNPTSKSGHKLRTKFKPPKKNHNLLKTGADRLYFIRTNVSFRQACMNFIKRDAMIGYPTIQKRITDGDEKLPNATSQSQRSQRAIQNLA